MDNTLDQRILGLIKKYMEKLTQKKVLTSMEEVVANTNETNLVAAPVVAELNNKLGDCSFETKEDGAYVKYTLPGGADPVLKKLGSEKIRVDITVGNQVTIGQGSNNPNSMDSRTFSFTVDIENGKASIQPLGDIAQRQNGIWGTSVCTVSWVKGYSAKVIS